MRRPEEEEGHADIVLVDGGEHPVQEHIVLVGAGRVRRAPVRADRVRQAALLGELAGGGVVQAEARLGVVPKVDELVVLAGADLLRVGSAHALGPIVVAEQPLLEASKEDAKGGATLTHW